jgi:hypothetical protein
MSDCTSPWFAGHTCDHLYADCPNRTRAEASLRRYGMWDVGTATSDFSGSIDPHGTDVCGVCLHRHNQREHNAKRLAGLGASTEEER